MDRNRTSRTARWTLVAVISLTGAANAGCAALGYRGSSPTDYALHAGRPAQAMCSIAAGDALGMAVFHRRQPGHHLAQRDHGGLQRDAWRVGETPDLR